MSLQASSGPLLCSERGEISQHWALLLQGGLRRQHGAAVHPAQCHGTAHIALQLETAEERLRRRVRAPTAHNSHMLCPSGVVWTWNSMRVDCTWSTRHVQRPRPTFDAPDDDRAGATNPSTAARAIRAALDGTTDTRTHAPTVPEGPSRVARTRRGRVCWSLPAECPRRPQSPLVETSAPMT